MHKQDIYAISLLGKYVLSSKTDNKEGNHNILDAHVSKTVSSLRGEKNNQPSLLTVSKKWEKLMTPPVQWTGGVAVSYFVSENRSLTN